MVPKVKVAPQVPQENMGPRALLVQLAMQEIKVPMAKLGLLERQVLLDPQVHLVKQVLLAKRVLMAKQETQDTQERKEKRVPMDQPVVLVAVAPMERLVSLGLKAILELQALKVVLATLVKLVLPVIRAPWVFLEALV